MKPAHWLPGAQKLLSAHQLTVVKADPVNVTAGAAR